MRISALTMALSLFYIGICGAQSAHASVRKETQIPAEPLETALQVLAKNYDLQVLYRPALVKGVNTRGVVGSLTSDEALTAVLSGSGLSYKYLDVDTVTVVPIAALSSLPSETGQSQTSTNGKGTGKEVGKAES